MSLRPSLTARASQVFTPTPAQALGAGSIASIFLIITHSQSLLMRLGITPEGVKVTQGHLSPSFGAILRSSVASNLALVSFWATVGLVAYLVCWGIYNIFVEARNEVTLTTAYTNRGHWRGARETLALKVVSAIGLAVVLGTLSYSLALWISLANQAVDHVGGLSALTIISGLGAVFGLAIHLYLIVVFLELTFTPWYRA